MPLDLSSPELQQHFKQLVDAIRLGRLVPFLGAGVNLCRRSTQFIPGQTLPSGGELAAHLAQRFGYPAGEPMDLARVCQYAAVARRTGELSTALREIFEPAFPTTKIHDLIAGIPGRLARRSEDKHLRLIVTTNYDDLMEVALEKAQTPYDLVWYEAEGRNKGRYYHKPYGAKPLLIDRDYDAFEFDRRPVVLKIHGAIDRVTKPPRRPQDSFVISEDHYIDYVALGSSGYLPALLTGELGECSILFVGYGLRDWNLRAFLRQAWQDSRLQWQSWAVQKDVDELDRKLWESRGVDLLDVDLGVYADGLEAALQCLP